MSCAQAPARSCPSCFCTSATTRAYNDGKVEEGIDDVVSQQVRLEAQGLQLGVLGIVVMLLLLNPGVGYALHLCTQQKTHQCTEIEAIARVSPVSAETQNKS